MDVKVVKVVGKQGNGVWGNVHEFWPDDNGTQVLRGRLVVVGELLVADEEGAGVGKEFLTRTNEVYYSQEGSVSEAIAKTKRIIAEEFEEAELVIVVVVDEWVYVSGGGVRVWVGGREGWVIDPGGSEINAGGIKGKIRNNMKLVMGTKKFWDLLPLDLVRQAVLEKGDEEIEGLVAELHKQHGGVGAILQFQIANDKLQMNEETIVETQDSIINDKSEIINNEEVDTEYKKEKKSWREKIQEILPKERVYVNEVKPGGYKKIIFTGVGVLAIFLMVFVAGRIKNREVNKKNDVSVQQVEQVIAQYNEAKSLVVMNRDRSQQLLAEVTQELDSFSPKQLEDERIKQIKQDLGEVLGMASGVIKIELSQLVDLNLVREGARASKLIMDEKAKLLVMDENGGRVFEINAQTGAAKVLVGKEVLGDVKLLSNYPGKYIVISNKGLVECIGEATCNVALGYEEEMGKAVDAKMWAGNIYLLESNQIWKYSAAEKGYGAKKAWLGEGEQIGRAAAMAMDGSIWVLDAGRVSKYTAGVKEEFLVSGWEERFSDNVDLYLDENTENIYILERDKKRVVVFKKNGEYVKQWVNDKFESTTDFLVNEQESKIYFGTGSVVYEYKF